jgi:methionyl-tRNA formyltransferase
MRVEELVRERYESIFTRHCVFGDTVDQDEIAADGADYLFSFGPLIVRSPLLGRIRRAAVNFHTGPPRWPGRGSVSFALLNADADFGVTAHLMVEELDRGPILRVLRFPIERSDDVASLDARTKATIPELVAAVLDDLERTGGVPRPTGEQWERKALTQDDLLEQMRIGEAEDDAAVARKIRAFSHPTKPGPYLERAGQRFWYLGHGRA